jgi:tetrapyrrole methylase family protein/MazG family protein
VPEVATGPVEVLDRLYDRAEAVEHVYAAIVEEVVAAARAAGPAGYVAYAVPGSPLVAERSVELLRADERVAVDVRPAMSFLDLAWARLGVDPLSVGVRLVDGTRFEVMAAGERGPLLVAQCDTRAVLSAVKLAADDASGLEASGHGRPDVNTHRTAVLLHHLGLADEQVVEVDWADLDRTIEPDHLTSLWVPAWAAPVASELARLQELVRTLRARCPWDRRQTHGSLARHLLEEAYESLDAIETVARAEPDVPADAVAHLEEELGDLLFQVYFQALLAAEEGYFTLADVARTLHDKLVGRHPHVFGDAVAETPEEVAARWEVLKKAEKGRGSVTDGIPAALPALALAAKLQRKAEAVGLSSGTLDELRLRIEAGLENLVADGAHQVSGETLEASRETVAVLGEMLFALADVARRLGVDPESALRGAASDFRGRVAAKE